MLDDIRGTILNLTRNVSKTSGVLVKTTKLSVTLAQEQEALRTLYIDIGKKVHEIYQYGGSLGKFFDEKYREIESLETKINNLKEDIAKIKGVKECPKCGKQVDKNAEFCPKCGLRLDGAAPAGEPPAYAPAAGYEPSAGAPTDSAPPYETPATYAAPYEPSSPLPEEEKSPPPIVAAPQAKTTCRACGAENDTSTKFCLSCGRYL